MSNLVKGITVGKRIRSVDLPDFRVAEVQYAPKAAAESHVHEHTYLSLVLRGGFEEWVGRSSECARSAGVVVMPAWVTHGERFGPLGARSVTIALKPSFLSKLPRRQHALGKWRWFHGGSVARLMLRVYREFLLADDETGFDLAEILFELCEAMGSEPDRARCSRPRCVTAAMELLHARGSNGIRLADLAADLGTDPAYLSRAFRRRMGCTMSAYRRRLWVREAAHLLASTDAPLGEVALAAGFADQSHLCRVFKAEMGLTPQAYRLLSRQA